MNFEFLKIGLLCSVVGLAGCGLEATDTSDTTGATATGSANTGTVSVAALPGSIVSVGGDGTNFTVVGSTGIAEFTGLTPGAVDVHIFKDSFSAVSYIGVNSSSIVDSGSSFIDINISVVNPDGGGQTYYLYDGLRYRIASSIGSATVSFGIGKPVGSQFTATIYAAQGLGSSSAGNTISESYAEVINLGTVTVTSTAAAGTTQANLTANFAAALPTAPALVTINSVTPPAGLNIDTAEFSSTFIEAVGGITLPDTVSSALRDDGWLVSASDGSGKSWEKRGTFTTGGTMDITATMTLFPTAVANQSGATVAWENPAGCTKSFVEIADGAAIYTWAFNVASNVSSITLPTPPTGAVSPLTTGTAYDLSVYCDQHNLSFDELAAIGRVASTYDESTATTAVPYTR